MNCSSWQKFYGAWLGSVVAIIRQKEEEPKYDEDWLLTRRAIAVHVLKASRLDIISLAGLEQFFSIVDKNNANEKQDLATLRLNQARPVNQQKLAKHENIILSLLPLIIFSDNDQELLRKLLDEYALRSLLTLEEQEDILIWSQLLDLSFNRKFTSQDPNDDQIIRQLLNTVRVKSTLPNKLEIVVRAWEQGLSLYQLTEELYETDNPSQIAIALAVYCFISTPRHFELSIKRAENTSLSISWLVIALTATLSGAYNGIAEIPWNWRASANKQQTYQSEFQLAAQMFGAWMGIYSPKSSLYSYNQELDAVDQARAIQARKTLKIISQNNNYKLNF